MLMSSAALTGPNACFVKKMQAREGNAQPIQNRVIVVLATLHFKRIYSAFLQLELHLELAKLDEGEGIAETLLKHNASWHKSCRVQYNSTKEK